MLAVTTSQAQKLLSDAIGNGDKILVDSDGKVPDGDQTRNDLTKALESARMSSMISSRFLRFSLMLRPIWMPRSRP